ncbi:MAG TPA: ATP-binding cassette domain-containing protein [Spirochaetia bacterium]|nr:ATP-binding cassette domain-containing protein [Spirochaetia bacterium]
MNDATAPALFSLRGVRAELGGRPVLTVDSLEIPRGRTTVLMGENGSGKTTLLRLLNGLLEPAAGVIRYEGRGLADDGAARLRRETVMVHQAPLLFRGSVRHNVRYGLRIRGVPGEEIARRVAAALARVGLPGFEHRRAGRLSGGEMQRVAIARALVLEPRVLLLDEPTASVDHASRLLVEEIVHSLASAGATVIVTTHNRELAYRLCDNLLVLSAGAVTAGQENILRGAVEHTDEHFTYFRSGGVLLRSPARQGDFTVAVLPLDDVILSGKPLSSSARNQLPGRITRIEPEGSLLRVTVDCGPAIQSLITESAAEELAMETGRECMVTFKASAVRLY